jgi:hypothetical protein
MKVQVQPRRRKTMTRRRRRSRKGKRKRKRKKRRRKAHFVFHNEVYYTHPLCLCGCGELRDKAMKENLASSCMFSLG